MSEDLSYRNPEADKKELQLSVEVYDNIAIPLADGKVADIIIDEKQLSTHINRRVNQADHRFRGELKVPVCFGGKDLAQVVKDHMPDYTADDIEKFNKIIELLSGSLGIFWTASKEIQEGDKSNFIYINTPQIYEQRTDGSPEQLESEIATNISHEIEHLVQFVDAVRSMQLENDSNSYNTWGFFGDVGGRLVGYVGGSKLGYEGITKLQDMMSSGGQEAEIHEIKNLHQRRINRREFLKVLGTIGSGIIANKVLGSEARKQASMFQYWNLNQSEDEARIAQEQWEYNESLRLALEVKIREV